MIFCQLILSAFLRWDRVFLRRCDPSLPKSLAIIFLDNLRGESAKSDSFLSHIRSSTNQLIQLYTIYYIIHTPSNVWPCFSLKRKRHVGWQQVWRDSELCWDKLDKFLVAQLTTYIWEIQLKIQLRNTVENTVEKNSWEIQLKIQLINAVFEIQLRNLVSEVWDKLDKFLVGQLTNVASGEEEGGQWKIIDW